MDHGLLSGATHVMCIGLAQGYLRCQLDNLDMPNTVFTDVYGSYK
jgi:hypothetical protein